MAAEGYIDILRAGFIPFIKSVYPDVHRLMQDNDPKHASKLVKGFLEEGGVNWWKTPAELPDCKPIENLWHELKEYIKREVKPSNKKELVDGLYAFWETVSVAKCQKYINYPKKSAS